MFPYLRRFCLFMLVLLALLLALSAAPVSASSPNRWAQEPTATPAAAARNANLRAGPGTNYAIVGGVKSGQALDIVATNAAGDWYKLASGTWIFGQLVKNAPSVPVDDTAPAAPAPAAAAATAPVAAPAAAAVQAAPTGGATLIANSAADWPGGKDHNFWFYLFSDGRNNFNWQEMRRATQESCFTDTANFGMEICADSIKASPRGDVAVQWKASKGGTYRFEWDSSSLKFYKHADLVGIIEKGAELPYAATIKDVIEWEQFFWVAPDSTSYHIRIFKLSDDAAQAAPAAQAAVAPIATFGPGMKIVGRDVAPGTYRAAGSNACYWERLSGFSGTLDDIIANELSSGPQIVTISATDTGFNSARCGVWTLDLSPITASPDAPFSDGFYFVGKDVAPGTWQASGGRGCYWATLSGFSGEFRDLHANDLLSGSTVVTLRPEDTGFETQRCGTWTKID